MRKRTSFSTNSTREGYFKLPLEEKGQIEPKRSERTKRIESEYSVYNLCGRVCVSAWEMAKIYVHFGIRI